MVDLPSPGFDAKSNQIPRIKEFATMVHLLFTFFIQKRRENSNRIEFDFAYSPLNPAVLSYTQ